MYSQGGSGQYGPQSWTFPEPPASVPLHGNFVSQLGFHFRYQPPVWAPLPQQRIQQPFSAMPSGYSNPTYTNNLNNNYYNNTRSYQEQASSINKNNKRPRQKPLVVTPQRDTQREFTLHGRKRLKTTDEDGAPPRKQVVIEDVPVPKKGFSQNTKITESIWRYFESNKQSDNAYKKKVDLRDALYAIFADVFPYCGLYMVGSSMSGFATKTSDMDLCLMISQEEIDPKREAVEILMAIQKALRKLKFIKRIQLIRARVPILKFQDYDGHIECDLNINNSVGIRNTHLLRYYASMDWRVRPLVLFMKKWARFHDINDASKKTISSYSLCLMMLHYLQYGCKPQVLDSVQKLHPTLFDYGEDIRNLQMNTRIEFKSKNSQSLGDLFLGFLNYYTNEFDFDMDVASVRIGTKIPIHMVRARCKPQELGSWGCLKVEEPFDLSNTARSCYDPETFSRVRRVFAKSYRELALKRNAEAILSVPF